MEAGYFSSKCAARVGRAANPPPQLGHFPASTVSAHEAQKVHSKEQIRASVESGGRSALQHSQLGLNWSMASPVMWRAEHCGTSKCGTHIEE